MGIDLLDIKFNLEKEFEVSFADDLIIRMLERGNTKNPPRNAMTDIQVKDLFELVNQTLESEGREVPVDLEYRVKKVVSESLFISVQEICSGSWLVADLGAE